MKKILNYLAWIPFAVCIGSLTIYIVHTVKIKFNPAIIVTDQTVSVLKTYLMIALISLFIGLLIMLVKKIYKLLKEDDKLILQDEKQKSVVLEEKDSILKTILNNAMSDTNEDKKENKIIIEKTIEYEFKSGFMLCHECGKKISKEAVICPNCGILYAKKILKVLNKYKKEEKTVNVERKPKKNPMVILANILLIILFLILICLVTNLVLNKAKENKVNITPTTIIDEN